MTNPYFQHHQTDLEVLRQLRPPGQKKQPQLPALHMVPAESEQVADGLLEEWQRPMLQRRRVQDGP